MSEYVNNSNANISHGIHAPVVNYQQISTPHQPQPRPMTDPGGKFDLTNTARSYISGKDTAKKDANDKAKNEYALEVRRLTAAREQGKLEGLAYQTAVRTAGDKAIAAGLSAEDVATIESKHSFGYLSTEQKRRDLEVKNSIEFDNKAIEHMRSLSPSLQYMGYDNAKNTLLGLRADKETADFYSQKYLTTGNEAYKPFATRALSNILAGNFERELNDKYYNNNIMPTQADINNLELNLRRDLVNQGYTEDMVDIALGIARESSAMQRYADVELANRTFTIQQNKDMLTDEMQRTEMEIIRRFPTWRIAKSLGIHQQLAEGALRDLPLKEQDKVYKNVQDVFLEGTELVRDISQSKQLGALPYTMLNSVVNNPSSVTPTTGVNTVAGSLNTVLRDNSEAVQSNDPKQIETASKNLSNLNDKGIRNYLEKQLTSKDPEVVRKAQTALDALNGIAEAKLAIKLKTINNSPFKGLESSTANERMYVDPLTGDLKLRRATGFAAPIADVFYGKEFEQNVKDINTLINEITDKDPEKKAEFFNKYFGLDSNSNEIVSKPLPTIDDSGLYRDGGKGEGRIGGYAGLGGMMQIDEAKYARERETEAERKAEAEALKENQHQEYLDTFRDLTKPTIDIDSLPVYDNGDGTVSSMKTITIGEGNKQILIPTIRTENGKRVDMSDEEAIEWYHKTGGHFGKYDTVKEAKAAAEKFSAQQGEKYRDYTSRAQAHLPIAAKKYGVDEKLLSAMFEQESAKGTKLKSKTGVTGAMQITTDTWNNEIAPALGFSKEDRKNPEKQMEGGAWYARKLIDDFNGDIAKAVAAYNGGAGVIAQAAAKYPDSWTDPRHLAEFIKYTDKPMEKAREIAGHLRGVIQKYNRAQQVLTATASVSNSSPIVGASVDMSDNEPSAEELNKLKENMDRSAEENDLQGKLDAAKTALKDVKDENSRQVLKDLINFLSGQLMDIQGKERPVLRD